ncbi:MAG TPA: hypothetical protein VF060_22760 [Trebonia sp.]
MGDARTGARAARGAKRGSIRRRAVGTRDRIISHLTAAGDITDPTGMASTKLAEAVGYPGSSVAFAQLLSGMERDGLIVREVRGKRTYRITLPEGVAAARAMKAAGRQAAAAADGRLTDPALANTGLGHADLTSAAAGVTPFPGMPAPTGGGFDYDELARRLLVQVLRKLASASVVSPSTGGEVATVDVAGAVAERDVAEGSAVEGSVGGSANDIGQAENAAAEPVADLVEGQSEAERAAREQTAALEKTVADLERELATAWTRHGSLTAENARLREQLSQTQRDLVLERTRRTPLSGELNQAEVVVLERLLDARSDGAQPAS